ncbi:DUF305 domain-containing protein [Mycobacterium sp. SMC-4]|uniref:DUF305 domain-containing protein n=1 Tax=Mycobacterium sp. SMC-4 TaxID=2857059 RepID=UPI0021B2211B|nr:DUF305 domain-containing protein [Mycobacterium sp. SMC-4]UXA18312.1 DUF305 domain-containing protein [Mycobacterium sp. SMC-4]
MKRTIALVGAVLAALTVAACGGSPENGDTGEQTTLDAPVITGEPAGYNADDVAFATGMVAHHKQAIELSTLAGERSADPQVIALAQQIAAVAQPEINVLNVFLVQWNENPEVGDPGSRAGHPSTPGTPDEATTARLRSLRGVEFDRLWLDSMIDHHRAAVQMAKAQIADGANVDAIAMARQMVATAQAEIDQMGQLQKELG